MNPLDARQAHRTLGLGLILGIATLLLWTSNAAAGQFTPPTPRQAQRILGHTVTPSFHCTACGCHAMIGDSNYQPREEATDE